MRGEHKCRQKNRGSKSRNQLKICAYVGISVERERERERERKLVGGGLQE